MNRSSILKTSVLALAVAAIVSFSQNQAQAQIALRGPLGGGIKISTRGVAVFTPGSNGKLQGNRGGSSLYGNKYRSGYGNQFRNGYGPQVNRGYGNYGKPVKRVPAQVYRPKTARPGSNFYRPSYGGPRR